MLTLADRLNHSFLQSQVGTEQEVLFETPIGHDAYAGFTPNYTAVRVRTAEPLENQLRRVRIIGIDGETCVAELI